MTRKKEKVAFLVHCILNQSTRVWWRDGGADWERGMLNDVVEVLQKFDVGMVQMECPEFLLFGNPREPKSKDEYDIPCFIQICGDIAKRVCDMMEKYIKSDFCPGNKIVAIIGLENSPSCGVSRVTRKERGKNVSKSGQGHLIDELVSEMNLRGFHVPIIGMSLKRKEREERLRLLENFCSK